jgi:hypothetical protein
MADERLNIVFLSDGAPALELAGATVEDPNTRSGNPHHEVGTGRFGSGRRKDPGKAPSGRRQVAEQSDESSVTRRRDAVVDAARTIEDLSADGVREFVQRRWRGTRALTDQDVEQFAIDAQRQRVEDVVDALDLRLRKAVLSRGGQGVVKIDFPRGLLRRTLSGLAADQVIQVLERLQQRGWRQQDVSRYVVRPYRLSKTEE